MACFVERAPCLPSRIWCISSRTNSPAWVVGDFPSCLSFFARSMVCCSGMSCLPSTSLRSLVSSDRSIATPASRKLLRRLCLTRTGPVFGKQGEPHCRRRPKRGDTVTTIRRRERATSRLVPIHPFDRSHFSRHNGARLVFAFGLVIVLGPFLGQDFFPTVDVGNPLKCTCSKSMSFRTRCKPPLRWSTPCGCIEF
jgi:hypothetical protein